LKSKEPKEPREKKAKARRRSDNSKTAHKSDGAVLAPDPMVQGLPVKDPPVQAVGDGASGHSPNGAVAYETGASTLNNGDRRLTEDMIRVRAYELFVARGCEHGHHLEDWLAAELELKGKNPTCA
jgi:hypothetical protein